MLMPTGVFIKLNAISLFFKEFLLKMKNLPEITLTFDCQFVTKCNAIGDNHLT